MGTPLTEWAVPSTSDDSTSGRHRERPWRSDAGLAEFSICFVSFVVDEEEGADGGHRAPGARLAEERSETGGKRLE